MSHHVPPLAFVLFLVGITVGSLWDSSGEERRAAVKSAHRAAGLERLERGAYLAWERRISEHETVREVRIPSPYVPSVEAADTVLTIYVDEAVPSCAVQCPGGAARLD